MVGFDAINYALDPILIVVFRLPVAAWLGFGIGLVLVALVATLIGELALGGAYAFNRKYFAESTNEMTDNHNLAVQALACKDKDSYKACNGLANDAFGKSFFSHIALFASSLWPVPFILSWLDFRFGAVDFTVPVIGSVGPAFLFIPVYILVRVGFARVGKHLPVFGSIKRMINSTENSRELLSYADIPTMGRPAPEGGRSGE